MNNNKGFTLIELIVVIAILGVLALILVPGFMGYLEDARKTTAQTNARNIYTAATAEAAKWYTKNMTVTSADEKNLLSMALASLNSDYESGDASITIVGSKVVNAWYMNGDVKVDRKGNEAA